MDNVESVHSLRDNNPETFVTRIPVLLTRFLMRMEHAKIVQLASYLLHPEENARNVQSIQKDKRVVSVKPMIVVPSKLY